MSFIKKNFKVIILGVMLIVMTSGVSIYATAQYLATEVEYKDGKSVASALDELYANKKEKVEYQKIDSGGFVGRSSAGTFCTKTVSIPAGKEKIYIYSIISSTWGGAAPTITSDIITGQSTRRDSNDFAAGNIDINRYISTIDTNGNAGDITIDFNCAGGEYNSRHNALAIIFYE